MRQLIHLVAAIVLIACSPLTLAQTNLGELLDAGGKRISAETFKRVLVGRVLAGPTGGGTLLDVIYIDNGLIRGVGAATLLGGATGGGATFEIQGSWTIDEDERVCASMRIGSTVLPPRCQFWFEHDQRYFLCDSDTDRSARVLSRVIKR